MVEAALTDLHLPKMLLVRQKFRDRRLADIPGAAQQQMHEFFAAQPLKPGASIAIGVGSRGISHLPEIVQTVVSCFQNNGLNPFIFPAMGSHGGAIAQGQKEVLAKAGITAKAMGCPIKSSMDVVSMGMTPGGIATYMDANAHKSDGVFLINRVKRHTDFDGSIESGLCKMATVGMGKQIGAATYHRLAYEGRNLGKVIVEASRHIFASGHVVGGLAILEDANNHTARLVAMPTAEIEAREKKLLRLVKGWIPRIPVPELDVLIVDEIGKNISGPGMDPKVVNRNSTSGAYNPLKWPAAPWVGRIFARSLSPASCNKDGKGNAMGIGMADVVHDRLIAAMDVQATRMNATTAQMPHVANIPMHFATDRKCLAEIAQMTANPSDIRIGWIQNSKDLGVFCVSSNLAAAIQANPRLEIIGKAEPFRFDKKGQLIEIIEKAGPFRLDKKWPLTGLPFECAAAKP